MSVIDYVDREVDVSAFQGISGERKVELRQALAADGESGLVLTGVAKLGQRFLLELLTERGSMKYLPLRGCTFMREARLGLIRTQTDLFTAFTRAMIDVKRSLEAEDAGTARDDEKFGSAVVESVEFAGGTARVFVRLASLDPAAVVILPVALALK